MGIYDREYYQESNAYRGSRLWDNRSMVEMLIVANVVFLAANFLLTNRTNAIRDFMGLTPEDLFLPLYWFRFVTAGFAHSGIWHLIFNMFGLYFLGRSVEDRYGKWEFGRIYFLTLIVSNILFAVTHLVIGDNPLVMGASGAVTGVVLLFVLNFPKQLLYLWGVVPVPAWLVGTALIVGDVLGTQGNSNVAHDVHLYGAGFAALYFLLGWNFSALGSVFSGFSTTLKQKKRGLKVHTPPGEPTGKDDAESDRILDKINSEGADSLTRRERAFLEKYSEKVRKRRGDS